MRALAASILVVATALATPAAAEETAEETDDDWRVLAGSIVMGTGIATIVAGATIGTVAAAKYADLDCPDDTCAPETFDEAEDYNALREPSGLLIATGGVLSVIGGAFLFAAFTDRDDVNVEAGPGYVGVRGRF